VLISPRTTRGVCAGLAKLRRTAVIKNNRRFSIAKTRPRPNRRSTQRPALLTH
jgi:hypothetical protein